MINLNEDPVQALQLKANDHVLVDGHEFVVEKSGTSFYMTAVNPEAVVGAEKWATADYENYPYIHIRAGDLHSAECHAVMSRHELMARVQTKTYSLS